MAEPKKNGATRRAEAEARKAEADGKARAAEADARRSESEAAARAAEAKARIEAEQAKAAETRARLEDAQRARESAERDAAARRQQESSRRADAERKSREAMPWQIGATAVAMPAGIIAGVKVSHAIEKRHASSVVAKKTQLAALGKSIGKVVDKLPDSGKLSKAAAAKLSGAVAAADRLGLTKIRGPLGLVPAGLLLTEAALVRFGVTSFTNDERARAVAGGVATASVFAATNLVGERLVQNATLKVIPAAKDIAALETAKSLIAGNAKVPPPKPTAMSGLVGKLGPAAPVAGKVLSRALPIAAVAMAVYEGAKGWQKDGATGAALGVADSLTFGLISAGKAYLNAGAEAKAEAVPTPSPVPAAAAPAADHGDGRQGYTTVDGRVVEGTAAQVKAWENRRH